MELLIKNASIDVIKNTLINLNDYKLYNTACYFKRYDIIEYFEKINLKARNIYIFILNDVQSIEDKVKLINKMIDYGYEICKYSIQSAIKLNNMEIINLLINALEHNNTMEYKYSFNDINISMKNNNVELIKKMLSKTCCRENIDRLLLVSNVDTIKKIMIGMNFKIKPTLYGLKKVFRYASFETIKYICSLDVSLLIEPIEVCVRDVQEWLSYIETIYNKGIVFNWVENKHKLSILDYCLAIFYNQEDIIDGKRVLCEYNIVDYLYIDRDINCIQWLYDNGYYPSQSIIDTISSSTDKNKILFLNSLGYYKIYFFYTGKIYKAEYDVNEIGGLRDNVVIPRNSKMFCLY